MSVIIMERHCVIAHLAATALDAVANQLPSVLVRRPFRLHVKG